MPYIQRGLFIILFTILFSFCGHAQKKSSKSYLALGDSYTIGEKVSMGQRWPVLLVDSLRVKNIHIEDPKIIAQTGWTTLDLQQAINKADLAPPYHLVSLLIGVNDQYQHFDIKKYPERFKKLLNKALELAGNRADHVLVLSIPDYGVTPFGKQRNAAKISQEIASYNDINKRIADELGVHYINITSISRQAESDPSLTAKDGLHPSGKMYARWVEKVMPVLLSEKEKLIVQ